MVTAMGQWVLVPITVTVFTFCARKPLSTLLNNIASKSEHANEISAKVAGAELAMKSDSKESPKASSKENLNGVSEDKPEYNKNTEDVLLTEKGHEEEADSDHIEMMFKAAEEMDEEKLDSAYKLIEREEADPSEVIKNKSILWYLKFRCGNINAVKEITNLSLANNDNLYPQQFLGIIYAESKDYAKAMAFFDRAMLLSTEEFRKIFNLLSKCDCMAKIGRKNEAVEELFDAVRVTKEYPNLSICFKKLGELSDNDGEMSSLFLEKASEYAPNETSSLFRAAYALSNQDFVGLSSVIYKRLLEFDPKDAIAWNNLAIS